jgi:ribosomal protein S18 acetylase RimI-like enzyme
MVRCSPDRRSGCAPPNGLELREATEADVDAMVELQLAAWRGGFVPILPGTFTLPSAEEFRPRLAESLAVPGVRKLLAVGEAGRLVGWISYGANRDADAPPGAAEVRGLNVHPDHWRSGVGRALVERAFEQLAEGGYDEVTVWSFDENERANAFYEELGFRRDGAGQRREFSAGALEVRYRRSLSGSGSA